VRLILRPSRSGRTHKTMHRLVLSPKSPVPGEAGDAPNINSIRSISIVSLYKIPDVNYRQFPEQGKNRGVYEDVWLRI
jgi:hypothetical protein